MAKEPGPLAPGDRQNFETLQRAIKAGDACILSVTDRATGQDRAAVCAVQREKNGEVSMVPLAVLVWDNPYELFDPPAMEPG